MMMTRSGLLIERVVLAEDSIQETEIVAREIVRVDRGSVYELLVNDYTAGYLKLIITADDHVKAFAQTSRESTRIFLGTDLDFSDAVDSAIGVL